MNMLTISILMPIFRELCHLLYALPMLKKIGVGLQPWEPPANNVVVLSKTDERFRVFRLNYCPQRSLLVKAPH